LPPYVSLDMSFCTRGWLDLSRVEYYGRMSLRHALLGLLAERPASGYDLLKRFEGSLAFVWPATQSQLYTELNKLADAGLTLVGEEGPRGRKEYAITDEGRSELSRWLTETRPEGGVRNEHVLRTFFLWALTPADARAYFEHEAERAQSYLDRLQDVADHVEFRDNGPDRFARIALENGLRLTEASIEWARWAADHVDKAPPAPKKRAPKP
jgi:PadR family transcriptional regulator AphA